ncbi:MULTISPECIES: hypothetical protein [Clostridium]|uniref:hypothetical protein n=1 Tax=Clostridium TaxID=1485 RepID=UPI000AC0F7C5|nr:MULTISPECIES: hypothetical protein [Clostridium]MBY7066279.1 hypothetical protein [Clostridium sporogenes]MBY7069206.1 hypothetical protein [Clostridium sporogenes]MCW6065763.1 hypothetical protein [Clostridium sporogenes]MCW6085587.1 hypothetical protein [Clostridium sporogenes]MDU7250976.1 hypothetical protein [Clostridium sp.]
MYFYKILNFYNEFGQVNYKGLNINKNIPGSQRYGKTIAIMANIEDIKSNEDLEQITEEEYLKLKQEIEEDNKDLNTQPSQQDAINAKLLKDNANMQIELNKQKELNSTLLLKIAQLGGNTNA